LPITDSRRCVYGDDQRIGAFGEVGMLQVGKRYPTSVECWGAARTGARDGVLNFFIERYREAYAAEVDAFISCVEEGRAMSPDFSDGVKALLIAEAAERSFRTGQVVDLG